MPGRMEGKKTVVVGAGQLESELLGNGRAIATRFAREGAEVCAVDFVESRGRATVDEIRADGGTAHLVVADVGRSEDSARLVTESHEAMGRIDVLVNVVGINHHDGTPLTLEEDSWHHIMDVNFKGMWLTSKAVLPIMQEQGGGAITNISTEVGTARTYGQRTRRRERRAVPVIRRGELHHRRRAARRRRQPRDHRAVPAPTGRAPALGLASSALVGSLMCELNVDARSSSAS